MKVMRELAWGCLVALSAALVACGGGGTAQEAPGGMGTLRVALTDAPACGFDAVHVTVRQVRVHGSRSAADGEAGWAEVNVEPPRRIDLLALQNGVLEELGQAPLAPGRYQQLRLVLADTVDEGVANAVTPAGLAERPLDTPSALQSGLKLDVDLDVQSGELVDLVLDFDACKSVVRAGQSGRYSLKPVVSVIPRSVTGVRGAVAAGWPAGTTQVSLQQAGTVVKATTPDATGAFMLQPVAAGTYDVVVTAPGQSTLVVTGVTVAGDAVTTLNTTASAFPPGASASGTAAGRVLAGTTPVLDATTRVLQAIGSATTIEVAAAPVDASSGAYSHALPVLAPRVAAFAPAPATLSFAADASAAARYSVQAVTAAGTKTVGPLTVTSGATTTTDVTVP